MYFNDKFLIDISSLKFLLDNLPNPCNNPNPRCRELCIPLSSTKYTCLCKKGFKLRPGSLIDCVKDESATGKYQLFYQTDYFAAVFNNNKDFNDRLILKIIILIIDMPPKCTSCPENMELTVSSCISTTTFYWNEIYWSDDFTSECRNF